jgi:hypothetical protein
MNVNASFALNPPARIAHAHEENRGPRITGDQMMKADEAASLVINGGGAPKHTLDCYNGWLSPGGHLYPCLTGTHAPLANRLAGIFELGDGDGERLLTKAGWVRLSTAYEHGAISTWMCHRPGTGDAHYDFSVVTPAQSLVIAKWHDVHGFLQAQCETKSSFIAWLTSKRHHGIDGD